MIEKKAHYKDKSCVKMKLCVLIQYTERKNLVMSCLLGFKSKE